MVSSGAKKKLWPTMSAFWQTHGARVEAPRGRRRTA
jgi:hypothetical protein